MIDSEEDYQEGDEDDEDLDTRRPPSQSGRSSTPAPNRPGSNDGRGNVANNLLEDEDEDDIDSLLSSNARVEPSGITSDSIILIQMF